MIAPFCVDCEAPQRTHRQVLATRCEKIAFGECTMRVCVRAIKPQCAVEVLLLDGVGQLSIKQQIAGLKEITMLGDLFDGIAAIEQHTFFARRYS
jgi:hypothetical protein